MYTRKQYIDKEVTHRQYYSQFITPRIKDMVRLNLGVERIKASKDDSFNDIPLDNWDRLAKYVPTFNFDTSDLGSKVCILKEAAKQIRESQ